MPNRPPSSNRKRSGTPSDPLLERVQARVGHAIRVIKRRDRAALSASHPAVRGGEASSYELRALQLVYHALSRAHRLHREQTGEPVTPALKEAARAFKREPSVVSLAPVAGHLDAMGLLTW